MKKRILSLALAGLMLTVVMGGLTKPLHTQAAGDASSIISAGDNSSVAMTSDGSVWTWGSASDGQLGNGNTTLYSRSPVKIMDDAVYVSTGRGHSIAIKTDGSLWGWGSNLNFRLGLPNTTRNSPVPIPITNGVPGNIKTVSAGYAHNMAVGSDGSLWVWGSNAHGELGNGTTTYQTNAIKVMDDVVSVAAGYYRSFAVTSNGDLYVWGLNNGAYGNGGNRYASSRTPVKIMENVASVSVTIYMTGHFHVLVVKKDGTLWGWGQNDYGQLGDGTTEDRDTPVYITDGVKTASAGYRHSLILKTDGTAWAAGSNENGRIGDGERTWKDTSVSPAIIHNNDSHTFTRIESLGNNVTAVSAGEIHSMAAKSDGTVWTWGRNHNNGWLGDGTTSDKYTPVKVLPVEDSPGIAVSFTCPNFEKAVREEIEKPGGSIMQKDVEGIKTLYVCERGITSLAGIEYFTALEYLCCDHNKLTEIDVSKNLALKTLACYSNQLTSLDVSNNTKLERLECYDNYLPSKAAIIGLDERRTVVDFDPQKAGSGSAPPPSGGAAPNLSVADSWARVHIQEAYDNGWLIPELQSSYKNAVNRKEFVTLAMSWLRYHTGLTDAQLVETYATFPDRTFSDITDPVILAAGKLDITAGNDGRFNPGETFNRQDAAVMLVKIHNILNQTGGSFNTANPPAHGWTDLGTANSYARNAINFVGVNDIMSGSGGNFNPRETFSRQHSITVFNNIDRRENS